MNIANIHIINNNLQRKNIEIVSNIWISFKVCYQRKTHKIELLEEYSYCADPNKELEQLERLRFEDTPRRVMITHTIESYWIPSPKKTKSKLQL